MDDRTRLKGLPFVCNKGKNLILHLDRPDCIPCLVGSLGCNCGNRFSFMTADGIEQLRLDSPQIGPVQGTPGCASRDHGPNPGHLLRFLGIHTQNPGVGMGTAKNRSIEHVRQKGIRRVNGRPAHPFVGIDRGNGFPTTSVFCQAIGFCFGFGVSGTGMAWTK